MLSCIRPASRLKYPATNNNLRVKNSRTTAAINVIKKNILITEREEKRDVELHNQQLSLLKFTLSRLYLYFIYSRVIERRLVASRGKFRGKDRPARKIARKSATAK